jgi:dUTP pyrophosphatase
MYDVEVAILPSKNIPVYQTPMSAGADIKANLQEPVEIPPGERRLIPTGIFTQVPEGWQVEIRPRSGLAIKFGVTVLNSPGTIDADYRGEWGVILINHGKDPFIVSNEDRIAQAVMVHHAQMQFTKVDSLDESERGVGGFGHTGI